MRIVIDMQGAQTESRYRGIGRYSISLALAIVRNRGEHDVLLALNGLFFDTIEPIRVAFVGLLPQENIRVWHSVGPTRECDSTNADRTEVGEYVREAAISCMKPDVVLVTSLFEGLGDDAIVSIGRFDKQTPVIAILYDLIPLINPDEQFRTNPVYIDYYRKKIDSLKNCSALLAISENSRNEALSAIGFPGYAVTNISSGVDPRFVPHPMTQSERLVLFAKLGITKPFVMYTGGADERKNLERLIEAFAALPRKLRDIHQLVFVGRMPEECVAGYMATAIQAGLRADEIIFSGFVSDLELMQLYTACQLFVFPSTHEGFGLPPLEAMGCGAPVIASNTTSLPEVIGREDALFDPFSVLAITKKMVQALGDEKFREDLVKYGMERVKAFSWDECALKAINVLENMARPAHVVWPGGVVMETRTGIFQPRTLRILVSKLDHMGDFVLAIPAIRRLRARYPDARIEALVGSWNFEAADALGVFDIVHTLDYFSQKSSESPQYPHELDLLVEQMNVYDFAIDLRRQRDTRFILTKIPADIRVGYSTSDTSIDTLLSVCLPAPDDAPFEATELNRTSIAVQMLRLIDSLPSNPSDFISNVGTVSLGAAELGCVAIFPNAGSEVKEWGTDNFVALLSLLEEAPNVLKIGLFVRSDVEARAYHLLRFSKLTVHCGLSWRDLVDTVVNYHVCVANNSYGAHLASWCGLRVVGIYGGHETVTEWGPVFGDCRVLHVPVPCSPCHIADRSSCTNNFQCLTAITPQNVFDAIFAALKGVDNISVTDLQANLINKIGSVAGSFSSSELFLLAECISKNTPLSSQKKLFVDVSELVKKDARTGIQRVVRSILNQWLINPPEGFSVEPVYATTEQGYCYARKFVSEFVDIPNNCHSDEPIDYAAGDMFFVLDLQPQVQVAQRAFYQTLRLQGVRVVFCVYDLLCIHLKQFFPKGAAEVFAQWLGVVAENDGAVCISRSVACELQSWIGNSLFKHERPFQISWFHLGADVENSIPTQDLPLDVDDKLRLFCARPSFLMVGTLEPRKGYEQVLDAFEQLWQLGSNINLVIVGKQGWMVEGVINRLHSHPERNKRLFWLEAISDKYLEKVYESSACLIAASYGEGFGLPLIEAAQYKLPIIARDIPVFREVAGEYAYYFEGLSVNDLTKTIRQWLALYLTNQYPKSSDMKWLTWEESAAMLAKTLLHDA